ncbi:MAG: transglycosylase family protein [Actinomycetota bacterium]
MAVALVAAIASTVVVAAEARAESAAIQAKRAQVRQLEVELYALDVRAQRAAAADVAARGRVRDVVTRLRAAEADLSRARRQFGVARRRLSDRVVAIYRQHRPSTVELLMGSRSITGAVESYRMLRRVGRQDADVVRDVRALRSRLGVLRRRLVVERGEARVAAREAAVRRDQLTSAVSAQRAVVGRAQRSLSVLIAAERERAAAARLAALQAARARLAARARQPVSTPVSAPDGPVTERSVAAVSAPSEALQAIAQCESGGNPRALSPGGTYRGKYQFHPDTWRSLGGQGADPAAASEAEQDRVAALLYARAGASPWPVCGR